MTDNIIGTCDICHQEVYTNEYIDPCSVDGCNTLCHMNCTEYYEYCDECEQPVCYKHYAFNNENYTALCPTCAKKAIANRAAQQIIAKLDDTDALRMFRNGEEWPV